MSGAGSPPGLRGRVEGGRRGRPAHGAKEGIRSQARRQSRNQYYGPEVTIVGAIGAVLTNSKALGLSDPQVGLAGTLYVAGNVVAHSSSGT